MNAQEAIKYALKDLVNNKKQFTHYDVTKHARSFTDDNVIHKDVIAYVSVEMDEQDGYYIDTVNVGRLNSVGSSSAVLYSPDKMYSYQYSHDDIKTNKSLKKTNSVIDKAMSAASTASAFIKKFQGSFTPGLSAKTDTTPSGHKYTTVSSSSCCSSGVTSATSCCNTVSTSKNIREVIIDNRGRVCIPKAFIDRIGKIPGDIVYVQKSTVQGKLVISAIKWSSSSCTQLGAYQVDCYGNVRVTSKSLSQCNIIKNTKNGSEYVNVRSEPDHIVIE